MPPFLAVWCASSFRVGLRLGVSVGLLLAAFASAALVFLCPLLSSFAYLVRLRVVSLLPPSTRLSAFFVWACSLGSSVEFSPLLLLLSRPLPLLSSFATVAAVVFFLLSPYLHFELWSL